MILSFLKEHEPLIQSGAKIHTLRDGERWHEGMAIQFYTDMYQKGKMRKFHPDHKVISVQEVFMSYINDRFEITIDDTYLYWPEQKKLSINDGFTTVEEMVKYFFPSYTVRETWKGQLIHWTDLKY